MWISQALQTYQVISSWLMHALFSLEVQLWQTWWDNLQSLPCLSLTRLTAEYLALFYSLILRWAGRTLETQCLPVHIVTGVKMQSVSENLPLTTELLVVFSTIGVLEMLEKCRLITWTRTWQTKQVYISKYPLVTDVTSVLTLKCGTVETITKSSLYGAFTPAHECCRAK